VFGPEFEKEWRRYNLLCMAAPKMSVFR